MLIKPLILKRHKTMLYHFRDLINGHILSVRLRPCKLCNQVPLGIINIRLKSGRHYINGIQVGSRIHHCPDSSESRKTSAHGQKQNQYNADTESRYSGLGYQLPGNCLYLTPLFRNAPFAKIHNKLHSCAVSAHSIRNLSQIASPFVQSLSL